MAKWRPHRCKMCGVMDEQGYHISRNGLCERCALIRQLDNIDAMRGVEGPMRDKYREALHRAADRIGRPVTRYDEHA